MKRLGLSEQRANDLLDRTRGRSRARALEIDDSNAHEGPLVVVNCARRGSFRHPKPPHAPNRSRRSAHVPRRRLARYVPLRPRRHDLAVVRDVLQEALAQRGVGGAAADRVGLGHQRAVGAGQPRRPRAGRWRGPGPGGRSVRSGAGRSVPSSVPPAAMWSSSGFSAAIAASAAAASPFGQRHPRQARGGVVLPCAVDLHAPARALAHRLARGGPAAQRELGRAQPQPARPPRNRAPASPRRCPAPAAPAPAPASRRLATAPRPTGCASVAPSMTRSPLARSICSASSRSRRACARSPSFSHAVAQVRQARWPR